MHCRFIADAAVGRPLHTEFFRPFGTVERGDAPEELLVRELLRRQDVEQDVEMVRHHRVGNVTGTDTCRCLSLNLLDEGAVHLALAGAAGEVVTDGVTGVLLPSPVTPETLAKIRKDCSLKSFCW